MQEAIATAQRIAAEDRLQIEHQELAEVIQSPASDTSQTIPAAAGLTRMPEGAKPFVGEAIKSIVISIGTEAAKRQFLA